MNAGDTLTLPDLIAAWRADLRAGGADPAARERSRVAQAAFCVDLAGDPPAFASAWIPPWVGEAGRFTASCRQDRELLGRLAQQWAALPDGADPFEPILEAPYAIHALWEQHAKDRPSIDIDAVLADLVGTLWNIDPATPVRVSTAAVHRAGPAARIVDAAPGDDDQIACPQWDGPARSGTPGSSSSARSGTGNARAARRSWSSGPSTCRAESQPSDPPPRARPSPI